MLVAGVRVVSYCQASGAGMQNIQRLERAITAPDLIAHLFINMTLNLRFVLVSTGQKTLNSLAWQYNNGNIHRHIQVVCCKPTMTIR